MNERWEARKVNERALLTGALWRLAPDAKVATSPRKVARPQGGDFMTANTVVITSCPGCGRLDPS
jgi:hypothetical protein